MKSQKQVKVSDRAFHTLKTIAKTSDEYRGRGVTGVVDKLLFGEFTTSGSGRPVGTVGIKQKKSSASDKTKEKKC